MDQACTAEGGPLPHWGTGTTGERAQGCQGGPAKLCMLGASHDLGSGLQTQLAHSIPLSLKMGQGPSLASVASRVS